MTRRIRTAAVVVAALALATITLSAHMKLVRTLPAADASVATKPAQIQIWYTQAPDLKVSRLTLDGPSGAVKLGAVKVAEENSLAAAVEGAMADGKYTVSWQTAGTDGHVQKGAFAFTVRQTR